MKGRETKASPSTDLLVCLPSRPHLTLMPKPICSPGRPPEPNKRRRHHHHHYLKKSSTTRACGQASPLLWAKTKSMGSEIAEPTSPKVTCAGQIRVKPKTTACRSWQSVMEEIEKIQSHKNKEEQKKRPSWARSLSFKKEVLQFLTCMRGIRFDLCCFSTFHETKVTTEEEQEEYEDERYRENQVVKEESDNETSSTVFSKWFMVLPENQSNKVHKEDTKDKDIVGTNNGSDAAEEEEHVVPPPNALLLMRCRSAPLRSCLKENDEENNEEQGKEENEDKEEGKVKEKAKENKGKSLKSLMEENRKKENLLVMRYDSEFYKISSSGIAKETWIVGGQRDPLSRSGSWNK